MNRNIFISFSIAALAVACSPIPEQIEMQVSPTDRQEGASLPAETSQLTIAEEPTRTTDPNATSTPLPQGRIEPGTYRVGTAEGQVAPGIYFGDGTGCYWERLSGLGSTSNDIIANDSPGGQFYVEIQDTDLAFTLRWCSMAPLDEVPAPTEISLPIEPGVYIVGRDIEPGLYLGNGESCYWERLSGLGGTYDLLISNDRPVGQFYAHIKPTDLAFNLDGCSVMPVDQVPAPAEFLTHLEPGMYLVGRDISPGLYQGVGEGSCFWLRLNDATGSREDFIASDGPDGNFQVEVESTDFAFFIGWCSVDRIN